MNNTNDVVVTILGLGFTWEGIGIAIAAFLSIINFIKSIYDTYSSKVNFKKQMRINYITDKRVDWINKVRDTASKYISNVFNVTGGVLLNEFETTSIIMLYESENLLRLLLNFDGDIDSIIINKMNDINKKISDDEFKEAQLHTELLMIHLQVYLKLEWNRVNSEVKTGKYDSSQLKKETIELYKKYPSRDKLERLEIEKACLKLNLKDMKIVLAENKD